MNYQREMCVIYAVNKARSSIASLLTGYTHSYVRFEHYWNFIYASLIRNMKIRLSVQCEI